MYFFISRSLISSISFLYLLFLYLLFLSYLSSPTFSPTYFFYLLEQYFNTYGMGYTINIKILASKILSCISIMCPSVFFLTDFPSCYKLTTEACELYRSSSFQLLLSLHTPTTRACAPHKRNHRNAKPVHSNKEHPHAQKVHAQQRRPSATKNDI